MDSEQQCRYLTETNEFPYIVGMDSDEKEKAARDFLETVEDDSSWEDDCTYDQIFTDDAEVIAETEKDI